MLANPVSISLARRSCEATFNAGVVSVLIEVNLELMELVL